MRFALSLLLFLQGWLYAVQTDYDVAIVGTSPISMLEAIYHLCKNERVLILEADERCGGAWKTIDICGVAHVDLGCHLIGSDLRVKEFFERYFGCMFVCLEHPDQEVVGPHSGCPKGYYFSEGCYELISHLQAVIQSHAHALLLHRKLESIFIDSSRDLIELCLGDIHCTTARLILTPYTQFRVENPSFINQEPRVHRFFHLYFLVEDEEPYHFTHLHTVIPGMSRAMNLTPFLKLPKGLQLIVIQTQGENELHNVRKFFHSLMDQNYLSSKAKILASDTYVYPQSHINIAAISHVGGSLVEVLETASFAGMIKYLDKWKSAMIPFQGSEEGKEDLQNVSLIRNRESKEMIK